MSGNVQPQFTVNGNIQSVPVTAANTSSEGGGTIGTNIFLAFVAGSNGSYVEAIRFMPSASTATSMNATVGRIFISTVSTGSTTSANTYLWGEVVLNAAAAANASSAVAAIDFPLGIRLPAGGSILVTNHAAPASNTQWQCTVIGGDY
jgi:hypothetical protein